MAIMMEVEDDDVFFADLNRQISLLITDDEDDYSPPISSHAAVSTQAFFRTSIFPSTQPQYRSDQSKGTGVFIPTSSQFNRRRSNKHHQPRPTNTSNNYNSYNNNNSNYSNSYKPYMHQHQLPSQSVFSQISISHKKC